MCNRVVTETHLCHSWICHAAKMLQHWSFKYVLMYLSSPDLGCLQYSFLFQISQLITIFWTFLVTFNYICYSTVYIECKITERRNSKWLGLKLKRHQWDSHYLLTGTIFRYAAARFAYSFSSKPDGILMSSESA